MNRAVRLLARLLPSLGLPLLLLSGCEGTSHVIAQGGFGINLAGAEFGAADPAFCNRNRGQDGTDYFFPSKEAMAYYREHGLKVVRLPIVWERLQPQLRADLDAGYCARILECLDHAHALGCEVVLDLHNYGRYRALEGGVVRELLLRNQPGASGLTVQDLASVWLHLARRVRSHPAVLAYGLMNEPHDMGDADWHGTSREVVAALRADGDTHWLWVAGDRWSSALHWQEVNPRQPWVNDPLRKTAYEAHLYLDADGSGKYLRSFAAESSSDPMILQRGVQRLAPFAAWCKRNQVPGVIGEFGVPWQDAGWLPTFGVFLDALMEKGMLACAWAGGRYWGDYELSLEARGGQPVAPLQALAQRTGLKPRAATTR